MNLPGSLRVLGRLFNLVAIALLLPVPWSFWYGETRSAYAFLGSSAITFVVSAVLSRLPSPDRILLHREGVFIVAAGWIGASFLGAMPYLLSGEIPRFSDALFESTSGFTATGATILTDIEALGRGVLFWRSLTQWLGGLGIIVLFVAVLSGLGVGARFLYRLEMPGPTADFTHPRARETATALWKIYLALTVAAFTLYLVAGMSLYDALAHAFTTVATGGFSPRQDSMAAFSPTIQWIAIVFMATSGLNFSLLYALRQGRPRLFRDVEVWVYFGILAFFVAFGSVTLYRLDQTSGLHDTVRATAFQAVSILTSTGYATADYDQWPDALRLLLLMMMFVGGCAGSTSGGMKIIRVVIAVRAALRDVKLIFRPNLVLRVTVIGRTVPEDVARASAGFVVLYFALLGLGTLLLGLAGQPLLTAFTAALACISNIGPAFGQVGPTQAYGFLGPFEKSVLVALMWLGRLELMAIVALFTRTFWRR